METGALAVAGVLIDWQSARFQIGVDEMAASQGVVEEDFAAEGQLDLSVGEIQEKSSVVEQLVHFGEPGQQPRETSRSSAVVTKHWIWDRHWKLVVAGQAEVDSG